MPYRHDNIANGQYYHVFNRGVNRQNVFYSNENYFYCLRLISKNAGKFFMQVVAYCLMPNHYHFLIRQDGDVPISKFIQSIFNSYVQALNIQRGRTGTLFEGRFKHVLVNRDEYLMHLIRYIHLNPVTANLVKNPEDWPYSNYQEFIGRRNGKLIDLSIRDVFFASPSDYEAFAADIGLKTPKNFSALTFD
jgi:REP element-mobilizing transposase RayT